MTYRTRSGSTPAAASRVAVAPMDLEVSEAKAGNRIEKRDDWTDVAHANLQAALKKRFQLSEAVVDPTDTVTAQELRELKAMTILFTAVDSNVLVTGIPPVPGEINQPLDFEMGSLANVSQRMNADTVVFVFIRDSYSSAGRKALGAVAMIAGAAVGVAIIPSSAPTVCTAYAVDRDGRVIWSNRSGSVGDLRTEQGADALINALFAGLPVTVNQS